MIACIYDGYYMVVLMIGCGMAFIVVWWCFVVGRLLCLVYCVFGLVGGTSTVGWGVFVRLLVVW